MSPELQEWMLQESEEIKEGINKQQELIAGVKESIKIYKRFFPNLKDRI